MGISDFRSAVAVIALLLSAIPGAGAEASHAAVPQGYSGLVKLFEQWRDFERPTLHGDVPDYGAAAMSAKAAALPQWRRQLEAINTTGWPREQFGDYELVKAEMNGLDFNLRVLRPWARDPAFYVSVWAARTDVPLREGPVVQPEIELYSYRFPLSAQAQQELTRRIGAIPALLVQARENLKDANARDLWVFGVQELRNQSATLGALAAGTLTVSTLEGTQRADISAAAPELKTAVAQARAATDEFIAWLEKAAPAKTGPSGVGKDNYTWYQQNVHFVPLSWDEEVVLLRRELGGPAGGGVVTYSARGVQNVAVVSGYVGVYNLVAPEIGGGNTTVTVFRLPGK